jgi:hypothetical protein
VVEAGDPAQRIQKPVPGAENEVTARRKPLRRDLAAGGRQVGDPDTSLKSLEHSGEALAVLELGRKDDVYVSRGSLVAVSRNRIPTYDNEADVPGRKRDEQLPLVNRL